MSSVNVRVRALFTLTFASKVIASSNGMDMNMDGPMDLAIGSMKPYLHFTPGDMLWFMGWVPQSVGAMVGACIGLFLLAIIDRWIAATRSLIEAHWRRSAELMIAEKDKYVLPTAYFEVSADEKDSKVMKSDTYVEPVQSYNEITERIEHPRVDHSTSKNVISSFDNPLAVSKRGIGRVALPFIPSHDIPRGIIHATQAAIGFSFMLAIMTFQLAFILSICIGLGVGEMMFGRYGGRGHLF